MITLTICKRVDQLHPGLFDRGLDTVKALAAAERAVALVVADEHGLSLSFHNSIEAADAIATAILASRDDAAYLTVSGQVLGVVPEASTDS